jgi:hypothetical protein
MGIPVDNQQEPSSIVVRRVLPILWASGIWLVLAWILTIVVSIISNAGAVVLHLSSVAPGVLLWLVGSAWVLVRMRLVVSVEEVRFSNVFRSWHFRWTDISEVCVQYVGLPNTVTEQIPKLASGGNPPAIGFRIQHRRYVPRANATLYLNQNARQRMVLLLSEIASYNGVPFHVEPDRLSSVAYLTQYRKRIG